MKNITRICCFLLAIGQSVFAADDIYLRTGVVLKNVRVVDTTAQELNIVRNSDTIKIKVDNILRVEKRPVPPESTARYEMFSEQLHEEYEAREQLEAEQRNARVHSENIDSTWQITTTSGISHSQLRLVELINDTLVVVQHNRAIHIPIHNIRELRLVREASLLRGFLIGTGIGALVGLPGLIESRNYSDVLFIITTPLGALIGSVAGVASGSDYVREIADMQTTEKSATIRQILLNKFP